MIKDSEAKQIEANEILGALTRAGLVWDPKIVDGAVVCAEDMTPDEKRDAAARAVDLYEKYWSGLQQAGEHAIADKYFTHPCNLDDLRGYLPK
ncbi:hypothetical protein HAP94_07950 [Acidithiobacillus ferrivorans]|nr:hypothetical protein [Acidithiobacillus ferrivorans]